MKQCSKCKENKPLSEFCKNAARKDGLGTYCRTCNKTSSRKYYQEHAEEQSKICYSQKLKRIKENQKNLIEFFRNHPCVDCGLTDLLVLQLDHRDNKLDNVSSLLGNGYSWKTIEQEIAKCDVRCANCHMRKTQIEQNSFRLKYMGP